MKHLQAQIPARQRGIVLVVALLILMVMTIIGTSMLGTASLEERMAANLQVANSTYQASYSCFQDTIRTESGEIVPPILTNAINNYTVPQTNNCQDPVTGASLYALNGQNITATTTATTFDPSDIENYRFKPFDYDSTMFQGISIPITATSNLNNASSTLQIQGGVIIPMT